MRLNDEDLRVLLGGFGPHRQTHASLFDAVQEAIARGAERNHFADQIGMLAKWIIDNAPEEVLQGGAVDAAIQMLTKYVAIRRLEELEGEFVWFVCPHDGSKMVRSLDGSFHSWCCHNPVEVWARRLEELKEKLPC